MLTLVPVTPWDYRKWPCGWAPDRTATTIIYVDPNLDRVWPQPMQPDPTTEKL